MVSTMRCCAKRFKSLLRLFLGRGLLPLLLALGAQAAEIGVRSPRLTSGDDGYVLAADFNIEINARLEEAVTKGVVLFFVVDFELTRPRWYWFDERVVTRKQTFRLSYHALTRQYRLSGGVLHQNFQTLDEALRTLERLRNWTVFDQTALKVDETYLASIRLRLDLSQMPKTFQVSALSTRDWDLASDWVRWSFSGNEAAGVTPAAVPAVVPAVAPAAVQFPASAVDSK